MNLLFNVYAFIDDAGIPYYIGQTMYFDNRVKEHHLKVETNLQLKYVRARELIAQGFPLTIKILHSGVSKDLANVLEIYYMRKFPDLTNNYEKKLTYKSIKHGKLHTQVHTAWSNMKDRCSNPKNGYYADYGGRGINFHDSWEDFSTFYKDMGDPPSKKHSLDRIDNNKGYAPCNCRWATASEQARNTRRNHLITYKGKTKCLIDWSEELSMSYTVLRKRLREGWSVEETLETPINSHRLFITHNGVTKTLGEWSEFLKINKGTLEDRIFNMGWSTDRAFIVPKKKAANIILTYGGETKSLPEWAKFLGINRNTLAMRIKAGLSLEEAFNKKKEKPKEYEANGLVMTLKEWGNYLVISSKTLHDRIYKLNWALEKALSKEKKND